jgi:hypothetical protein
MFGAIKTAVIMAAMLIIPFASVDAAEMKTFTAGGYILECPDPGYTGVHPEVPSCTHNVLVQSVDRRMHRIITELQRQVSGRVTALTADDKERIDQMYAWLLNHIEVGTASIMDFHYLTTFQLVPYEMHQPVVENSAVNSAVNYLVGANANIRISQSTRINDGMIDVDKKDLVDAINKSKTILDEEFALFNPLDLPQSSPSAAVATPTN